MKEQKLVIVKVFIVCVCALGILQSLNVSLKKQIWSRTRLVFVWSLWQLWNAGLLVMKRIANPFKKLDYYKGFAMNEISRTL